jgi:hypothetical protein
VLEYLTELVIYKLGSTPELGSIFEGAEVRYKDIKRKHIFKGVCQDVEKYYSLTSNQKFHIIT